ncbi:MAG TPA: tetratricopeptide repeat protein, partial [Chryseolinea sp.]
KYNVSEIGLIMFGDELMNSEKNEEALKILGLNTELYPGGYRAFYMYGDCLVKLNRRDDAIKAYQKSLELAPNNEKIKKKVIEIQNNR